MIDNSGVSAGGMSAKGLSKVAGFSGRFGFMRCHMFRNSARVFMKEIQRFQSEDLARKTFLVKDDEDMLVM